MCVKCDSPTIQFLFAWWLKVISRSGQNILHAKSRFVPLLLVCEAVLHHVNGHFIVVPCKVSRSRGLRGTFFTAYTGIKFLDQEVKGFYFIHRLSTYEDFKRCLLYYFKFWGLILKYCFNPSIYI